MSVVLSVEDVGTCRKQLKIEVPQPALQAETERVVKEYARQARIPGFRKEKVPAGMVKQRFRKEIEQEVVDRLLPRYWHQAEAEQKLDRLLPPEVQDVDRSEEHTSELQSPCNLVRRLLLEKKNQSEK